MSVIRHSFIRRPKFYLRFFPSLSHITSPSTSPLPPPDSDHAECGGVLCLHVSTPFQSFWFRLSRTIGQNFGLNYRRSLLFDFIPNRRPRGGLLLAPSGNLKKK